MQIEIIGIGDEILTGQTVNTNASFISLELERSGLRVYRHTVLPDHPELLRKGLSEALERSQLVITTGGLGPTLDDNTRRIAAELFDSGFVFNEEIAADLKRRYGNLLIALNDQATVPQKARVLKNDVGTAPGFIFSKENRTLVLLPGPPFEMKKMLAEQVLPHLKNLFAAAPKGYRKFINLFNMGESAVDPLLREMAAKYPDVEIGIYSSYGLLNIQLTRFTPREQEALDLLEKPYKEIAEKFANNIYESNSGKIEEAVHNRFIEKKLTLSAAESCTGGSLSSRLTRLPGASKYFLGSTIVYANEMKTKVLGVSEALLQEKGAVSSEVVEKMVAGILQVSGSDFAVADTGIAGPTGGTPEKPVGTVWCGIGQRNGPVHVWKIRGYGTREMIIERTCNVLLAELLIRTSQAT